MPKGCLNKKGTLTVPRTMSDEHRQAMKKARIENRAVSAYLQALADNPPRRGIRRSPERIANRIAEIGETFDEATPLKQVQLIQERMNLEAALEKLNDMVDISELEADFVEVVAAYSNRKGISYAAWREMNVPVGVLKRGGVAR